MTHFTFPRHQEMVSSGASARPRRSRTKEIFIAVMGMTGAGKSTFISHCTDEVVQISEPGALESCTEEVRVHKCDYFEPSHTVYLVDTPGFDDTNRKDGDILKEIADWLTQTYEQKIQLQGILYLHRISDNRMGGCAAKNLRIFKQLCGENGLKNVAFVSTFWEKVDPAVGDARERALRDTQSFWGFFVNKGARIRRHMNTRESALDTISQFIPGFTVEAPEAVTMAIQTEMVDAKKNLNQTSAGQEVESEIRKERERMRQEIMEREREIRETKDKEMLDILHEEQEKQKEELRRRDKQVEELKVTLEKMHEEKVRRLEERLQKQQAEHMSGVDRINQEWRGRMEAERAADKSYYEGLLAARGPGAAGDVTLYDCATCRNRYNSEDRLRQHQKYRGHGPYFNSYSCISCGATYCSSRRLEYHQSKRRHGPYDDESDESESESDSDSDSESESDSDSDNEEYYECITCAKSYSSASQLASHQKQRKHGERCNSCKTFHPSASDLRKHQKRYGHGKYYNDDHACTSCHNSYRSSSELKKHEKLRRHGRYSP